MYSTDLMYPMNCSLGRHVSRSQQGRQRSKSCSCGQPWQPLLYAGRPRLLPVVGLPLWPVRSLALEGIGSRWPHYFPLNQPKEGFQRRLIEACSSRGGAVTHLQQASSGSPRNGGTQQSWSHIKNITYWHIFWSSAPLGHALITFCQSKKTQLAWGIRWWSDGLRMLCLMPQFVSWNMGQAIALKAGHEPGAAMLIHSSKVSGSFACTVHSCRQDCLCTQVDRYATV